MKLSLNRLYYTWEDGRTVACTITKIKEDTVIAKFAGETREIPKEIFETKFARTAKEVKLAHSRPCPCCELHLEEQKNNSRHTSTTYPHNSKLSLKYSAAIMCRTYDDAAYGSLPYSTTVKEFELKFCPVCGKPIDVAEWEVVHS